MEREFSFCYSSDTTLSLIKDICYCQRIRMDRWAGLTNVWMSLSPLYSEVLRGLCDYL